MPVFKKPEDFKTVDQYGKMLQKACWAIPDAKEPVNFVYLKNFQFDTDTKKPVSGPLVLVDCASDITGGKGLPRGTRWDAKGFATVTIGGKLLLEASIGKVVTLPLQRFLKQVRKDLPEIELNADEVAADAGNAAAAVPVAAPAAQAPGPVAPPARPTKPLPANPPVRFVLPMREGDHMDFIDGRIEALKKAQLPVADAEKTRALQNAQTFCNQKEYAKALALLNYLVKDVTYPDVPSWVLDNAARRLRMEELTEQYVAFLSLVGMKSPGDNGAQLKQQLEADKKKIGVVYEGMRNGVQAADPPRVKKSYEEWEEIEKARAEWAKKLRPLWLQDQTARMDTELKALPNNGAQSPLAGMLNQYGKMETLELAQMAEIQSMNYQKDQAAQKPPVVIPDYHKQLNVAELASIFSYSTANYAAVNKILRSKVKTPAEQKEVDDANLKFEAYIKAAKMGLDKLPIYSGAVIRCNKTLWQGFIDEIVKDGSFTEPSFMSSAKGKASGFGEIVIHISAIKTGRDISSFSLHPTEGEILFPPGATFEFFGGEAVIADGIVKKFATKEEFGKTVTVSTKVAKLVFRQK